MLRIRYMIVDHPHAVAQNLHVEGERFVGTALPADMVPHHHWHRLDANTVIVKGTYHDRHHKTLMAASGVTVLPATFSRQTIHQAIEAQGNRHHHKVLTDHAMPYDEKLVTADLVDWIAHHFSGIFDHEV